MNDDQVIYNDEERGIEDRKLSYSHSITPELRIKTDEHDKVNYASVLVNRP